METLFSLLIVFGFIILGFIIAEIQNSLVDNQEKTGIIYFQFISVYFTQKDLLRFLLAVLIGVCTHFTLPNLANLTFFETSNFAINGLLAYIVIGYAPSTVLLFVKRKVKEKTN